MPLGIGVGIILPQFAMRYLYVQEYLKNDSV